MHCASSSFHLMNTILMVIFIIKGNELEMENKMRSAVSSLKMSPLLVRVSVCRQLRVGEVIPLVEKRYTLNHIYFMNF